MFNLSNRQLISDKISKYLRYTTNKSLEKYKKNVTFSIPDKNVPLNFFFILPFVSLISFLTGYKLGKVIQN